MMSFIKYPRRCQPQNAANPTHTRIQRSASLHFAEKIIATKRSPFFTHCLGGSHERQESWNHRGVPVPARYAPSPTSAIIVPKNDLKISNDKQRHGNERPHARSSSPVVWRQVAAVWMSAHERMSPVLAWVLGTPVALPGPESIPSAPEQGPGPTIRDPQADW